MMGDRNGRTSDPLQNEANIGYRTLVKAIPQMTSNKRLFEETHAR